MQPYIEIPREKAYRLINHGPVVLVTTRDTEGHADIAPIAWACPVEMDPPLILLVMSSDHKTAENIKATHDFVVTIPHVSQADLVRCTGSVSGHDVDKFSEFEIETVPAAKVDLPIHRRCIGYMECKLSDVREVGEVSIVIGEVLHAAANEAAFDGRVMTEKPAGKTLHHVGGKQFAVPSDTIV